MSSKERSTFSAGDAEHSAPLTNAFLRAVRLYTYNTPIAKGKYRLAKAAISLVKDRPRSIPAAAKDGRRFLVDLSTGMEETAFFLGEYERFISSIAGRLIRKDDVCLDVGANFGWYTTMMAKISGPGGEVHSFEPVPSTFAILERNRSLQEDAASIFINNLALGERDDVLAINVFDDLPTGHATFGRYEGAGATTFECKVTPLDSYLAERQVRDISFAKVDIEGAEMMFLRGAESLFRQAEPPIFLMEIALGQTKRFGYLPQDLIEHLSKRAEYSFYKVDEVNERLVEIDHFDDDDIGANVFCIPAQAAGRTAAVISSFC